MPKDLTSYRVFIASPGGLVHERQAFRDVIRLYNEQEAVPRGVHFVAEGWETKTGGVGRPQSLINETVRACDYFVLLLHDRWGTPPADPGTPEFKGYTSGTEEEYKVAMDCYASDAHEMRDIVCLFKAVDPSKLSDPGEQLRRVLAFKKEIERQQLYKEFDEIERFKEELRGKLAEWLRHHEADDGWGGLPPVTPPLPDPEPDSTEAIPAPLDTEDLIEQAERLADEGKRVEAEAMLSRATSRGDEFDAFIAYGQFLNRVGRLEQADAMYERALELADQEDGDTMRAVAYSNLGNVLYVRGDLDGAEAMHRKALEIDERLGRQEGMATAYGNLGNVLKTRGDLDGAEAMHRKSLEIEKRLGRQEGMASDYGNLGIVLEARGDLDGAEAMYRKALEIDERLGRQEGVASDYGNLGNVLEARGDLAGARSLWETSLELYERIGAEPRAEKVRGRLASLDAEENPDREEDPEAGG